MKRRMIHVALACLLSVGLAYAEDKPAEKPAEAPKAEAAPEKPAADANAKPAEKPAENGEKPAEGAKPGEPAAGGLPDAAVQELKATVTAVKGFVQVREGADNPWAFVKEGQVFGVGAEFRTGPRSAVVLAIPPDQTITLDRLGTITLLQAIKSNGKILTDLGLRYGRTQLRLETGGVEHESVIHSPAASLAIRGSDVVYQHDGFTSFAYGEGHLEYINRLQRQAVAFGGNGVNGRVSPGRPNPAFAARADASVDAKSAFAGRTLAEALRTEQLPDVGGDDLRDLLHTGQGLSTFASGAFSEAPENILIFDLFFFSGFDGTNVDLSVTDPTGKTLSPTMLTTADGRGFHSGDGVEMSGQGQETVTYGGTFNNVALPFLPGVYTITVSLDPSVAPGITTFYVLQPIQAVNGGPALPTDVDVPLSGVLDNAFQSSETTTYTAPK
ncbi:MAG: hypothetical protein GC162_16260 [Planctomycetes bacterium]|nr:hypothetical protein [Planctomycetota bacterium]